jgi:CIC family chloride channel protein
LREVIFEDSLYDLLVLGELALPPVSVNLEDSLYEAMLKFLHSIYRRIPIERDYMGIIGILQIEALLEAHRSEIRKLKAG